MNDTKGMLFKHNKIMIDFIIGTIDSVHDGYIVLNTNSIGYMLNASATAIHELSSSQGEIKVYTHLAVSENAISLYGFYNQSEREVFLKLITVPKVGPKVALGLLSQYTAAQIINHILAKNMSALTKASGVGQKLAESIVFNLKGKFAEFDESSASGDQNLFNGQMSIKDEAFAALTALGFDHAVSLKLINAVYDENFTIEELISKALMLAGR